MYNTNSLGKRLLALFLSALLVLGTIPVNQAAAVGNEKNSVFSFETAEPKPIQYEEDLTYVNPASGGEGNGEVSYALLTLSTTEEKDAEEESTEKEEDSEESENTEEKTEPELVATEKTDVAAIDTKTGELTILKAGTVTVQATKAADGEIPEQTAQYVLQIDLAPQTDFAFENKEVTVPYSEHLKYTQVPTGGKGEGKITYAITEGKEVAEINEETGEVTVSTTGTITVEAAIAEDGKYAADTAAYSLTITQGKQTGFGFADPEPEPIAYKEGLMYSNAASGGEADGEISYAITSGADVATINTETGDLSILSHGTVTVTAKKAGNEKYEPAEANYTIVITKTPQTGFAFEIEKPDALQYEENLTFTNTASGGEGDGKITYAVADEDKDVASVDSDSGVLTVLKHGTVTVTATKAEDAVYAEATAAYTLVIEGLEQDALKFANPEPDAVVLQYAGMTFTNTASGGSGEGALTYALAEGKDIARIDKNSGTVTINGTGRIVVVATKAADKAYNEITATYTLVVLEQQNDFGFEDKNPVITYSEGVTYNQEPTGGSGNGQVTYEIVDGLDVATLDKESGTLTILKSGEVTVKAVKAAEGNYAAAEDSYTLEVKKADQTGFGFVKDGRLITSDEISYDEKNNLYSFQATGGESEGTISYTIEAGKDVAEFADQENQLKILKSGIVKLTATKAGDVRYNDAAVTLTLTVGLAQQWISFAEKNVNITYGTKSYPGNSVTSSDLGNDKPLVFSIDGDNSIGATIDPNSGEVSFADRMVGEITIKVTKDSDGCYAACEDTYTLTVSYEATPDETYTLNGDKLKDDSEWYTGDVTITAPSGYVISTDNSFSDENSWSDSVKCVDEGKNESYKIALKNEATGGITDLISVEKLYIDKTNPNVPIAYESVNEQANEKSEIVWQQIWADSDDAFGFSKCPVTVTVSPTDGENGSGIDVVQYSLDAGATFTEAQQEAKGYIITINPQYRDQVVLQVTDVAGHVVTINDGTLVVDSVDPKIETTLDGTYVYNEDTDIYYANGESFKFAFKATDENYDLREANPVVKVNDVDQTMEWTSDDTSGGATLELTAEGHYTITADFADRSGNNAKQFAAVVYMDRTAPEVKIEYSGTLQDRVDADNQTVTDVTSDARLVYSSAVTATITVVEENFYSDDFVVQVNGTTKELEWTQTSENTWKTEFSMDADGDYEVTVSTYKDRSTNPMNWSSNEFDTKSGTESYTSNTLTIDTDPPDVEVIYEDQDDTVANEKYYDANREAVVTITDLNFRPNDVTLDIKAVDVTGSDVGFTAPDLTLASEWTKNGENTWQARIPFDMDANYTVTLDYMDIAKHPAPTHRAEFTVDKVNPQDISIIYQEIDKDGNPDTEEDRYPNAFGEPLNEETFDAFYYGVSAEVTVTATDVTSGMERIELTVEKRGSDGATTINLPENLVIGADGTITGEAGDIRDIRVQNENGKMTVTFLIPEEFRGALRAVAVDMADRTERYGDKSMVVVDTIPPARMVSFTPSRIVDMASMKDVDSFAEGDASVMYFNTDAVVTFEITEANFYPDDVNLLVNDQKVAITDWTNIENDTWRGTLTFTDEGDYFIKATYQDRARNEMIPYASQRIVVDKTPPVITTKYSNTDVKKTIDGRAYLSDTQTVTITIKEHNFRADDVLVKVQAKNAVGADVLTLNEDGTVAIYEKAGKDRTRWTAYKEGTWRNEDDIYELTLTFSDDANYTFDVEYEDLATNSAADYTEDLFTVDKTPPTNLRISYSASVLEKILNAITFGFYKERVTVTISAEDDTSGILYFTYSYINAPNVSGVNAELRNQRIQVSSSGSTATATFTIPKDSLGRNNQFNGTVEFSAHDRAENSTKYADNKRIVVDNISPSATVTFNNAVQTVDGVSYYNEKIVCTIEIDEANFYSDDVRVMATKDGENYEVNVSWANKSADRNIGTFTLTEDGEYTFTIEYTDKSGNQMVTYISERHTLDTTPPTINVSNIKVNSANKDEEYGFVIDIYDANLDVDSMKPILTAVVKDENGIYAVKEIELGAPAAVEGGKRYTYTVDNLTEDALYTLTCVVQDMAKNETSEMIMEDGERYKEAAFSINRNGSTFAYGGAFTERLVNQYYVYSVDENVVIVEVNVDPIENYVIKLNGEKLSEGRDYTSTQTSNEGEWSKRIYYIDKDLFEAEGEYNIVVSSVDKAETTAFSDVKNLTVAFVVDQTKPVVTITGLEAGGRYQTDEQTVTLIPTDEGGRLNSLCIVVLDSDGNPLKNDLGEDISIRFEMSGNELLKYLEANDGKVKFTIPEGLNNQVRIICNDCAVNAKNLTNEYNELFRRVTVSQNQLVIFYANKPLFYGTVISVLVLVLFLVLTTKHKKRKDAKT